MRCCLFIMAAIMGCVAAPKPPRGVPSPISPELPAAIHIAVETAFFDQEISITSIQHHATSHCMNATNEEWNETIENWTFTAQRQGRTDELTLQEMSIALASARRTTRRLVLAESDAEIVDTVETESYRERAIVVSYRVGRAFGAVRVRLAAVPIAAHPDAYCLECAVREQPIP